MKTCPDAIYRPNFLIAMHVIAFEWPERNSVFPPGVSAEERNLLNYDYKPTDKQRAVDQGELSVHHDDKYFF